MSEQALIERIRLRHPAPAWAVFDHVRNQTGFRKRVRTADALALSLWPSNGMDLHGFEVKCSKSDLKKEFDDPTKSAEFSENCDYWWLVVSEEKLVEGFAIPEKWGVLCPHGKSLKAIKPAPKLESKPLSREFICGIARRFSEMVESRLKCMVQQFDVDEQIRSGVESQVQYIKRDAEQRFTELNNAVSEFEKASGVSIRSRWTCGDIGKTVRVIQRHGATAILDRINHELSFSREYVAGLEKFLSEKQTPPSTGRGFSPTEDD